MSLRRIITALAATGHARPVPGSRALRALQRLPRIITALLLFLAGIPAHAQPRTGIVYWDLDHLYDTVPALFYNDTDYTPSGRLAWDTERYRRKIARTAAVIDSMRMPLVALWSVENEAVVRDIAAACQGDYSYLHCTLNSLDGMDFALLYYGDLFDPHYEEPGRRYLYIEGLLYRRGKPMRRGSGRVVRPTRTDTVGLVLCSDTRMAEWVVRDLREERPGVKLIVRGAPRSPDGAFGLRDALERPARLGGATSAAGAAGRCATAFWPTRRSAPRRAMSMRAAICLIPRRVPRFRPTKEGVTGAATATPCRYSFTWSRFFWNSGKVFIYSHSQRRI